MSAGEGANTVLRSMPSNGRNHFDGFFFVKILMLQWMDEFGKEENGGDNCEAKSRCGAGFGFA